MQRFQPRAPCPVAQILPQRVGEIGINVSVPRGSHDRAPSRPHRAAELEAISGQVYPACLRTRTSSAGAPRTGAASFSTNEASPTAVRNTVRRLVPRGAAVDGRSDGPGSIQERRGLRARQRLPAPPPCPRFVTPDPSLPTTRKNGG